MNFDNVLDNLKENKNRILIISLLFIVFIILTSILSNVLENYNNKKSLEKALIALGEKVYTEGYYDNLKKEPKEYEVNGIKITLEDMFEIVDLKPEDYFYNRKTKETCNLTNSYVKIYPTNPYGSNDYKLEYNLDCGY